MTSTSTSTICPRASTPDWRMPGEQLEFHRSAAAFANSSGDAPHDKPVHHGSGSEGGERVLVYVSWSVWLSSMHLFPGPRFGEIGRGAYRKKAAASWGGRCLLVERRLLYSTDSSKRSWLRSLKLSVKRRT